MASTEISIKVFFPKVIHILLTATYKFEIAAWWKINHLKGGRAELND